MVRAPGHTGGQLAEAPCFPGAWCCVSWEGEPCRGAASRAPGMRWLRFCVHGTELAEAESLSGPWVCAWPLGGKGRTKSLSEDWVRDGFWGGFSMSPAELSPSETDPRPLRDSRSSSFRALGRREESARLGRHKGQLIRWGDPAPRMFAKGLALAPGLLPSSGSSTPLLPGAHREKAAS